MRRSSAEADHDGEDSTSRSVALACYLCRRLKDLREFQCMPAHSSEKGARRRGVGQKYEARVVAYNEATGEMWFEPLDWPNAGSSAASSRRASLPASAAPAIVEGSPVGMVISLGRYCIACGLQYGLHRPGDVIEDMASGPHKRQWVCQCPVDNLHPLDEPGRGCERCKMSPVYRQAAAGRRC